MFIHDTVLLHVGREFSVLSEDGYLIGKSYFKCCFSFKLVL